MSQEPWKVTLSHQVKSYVKWHLLCRLELEWARDRVFDMDIAQMFQRLVADAKHLRVCLCCTVVAGASKVAKWPPAWQVTASASAKGMRVPHATLECDSSGLLQYLVQHMQHLK